MILDEAQNTSPEQMKMFLTRLGFGSKMVVNGDVSQIDLPRESRSGLVEVGEILRGVEGVGVRCTSATRTWCATSSSSGSCRPTRTMPSRRRPSCAARSVELDVEGDARAAGRVECAGGGGARPAPASTRGTWR